MCRFSCFLSLVLVLDCILFVQSVNWEFGKDRKKYVVISQKSGTISPFNKVSKITLTVPSCMLIEYVYVEVHNGISTPAVTYNRDTMTVTVSYKLSQVSSSIYDIMAKGRRNPECGNKNHQHRHGLKNQLKGDRFRWKHWWLYT